MDATGPVFACGQIYFFINSGSLIIIIIIIIIKAWTGKDRSGNFSKPVYRRPGTPMSREEQRCLF